MRPAEKMALGSTAHFTLEGEEPKDFAIELPAGAYYIVWDPKRVDEAVSNIQATAQLLKTNGVLVDSNLLRANEIHKVARVGNKFSVAKTMAARIRVTNGHNGAMEFWM